MHNEDTLKLVGLTEGEGWRLCRWPPGLRDTQAGSHRHLTKGWQMFMTGGVCNGLQSVDPGMTHYMYCVDAEWVPGRAGAGDAQDPDLAIPCPLPIHRGDCSRLSGKDASLPPRRDLGLSSGDGHTARHPGETTRET